MPRTKLSKRFNPTPPIDWLRAAVLERQAVLGYDLKKLSTIGGVSYDSMRHYILILYLIAKYSLINLGMRVSIVLIHIRNPKQMGKVIVYQLAHHIVQQKRKIYYQKV